MSLYSILNTAYVIFFLQFAMQNTLAIALGLLVCSLCIRTRLSTMLTWYVLLETTWWNCSKAGRPIARRVNWSLERRHWRRCKADQQSRHHQTIVQVQVSHSGARGPSAPSSNQANNNKFPEDDVL